MGLAEYKWVIVVVIFIVGIVGSIVFYNKYVVEPKQKIDELEKEKKELEDTIAQNQTKVVVQEETQFVSWITVLFILSTLILGGVLVYGKIVNPMQSEMLMAELVSGVRQYMYSEFGIDLKKHIAYAQGSYKADAYPVACIVYSTIDSWKGEEYNLEPPHFFTYGVLVDRRNIANIIEIFPAMSVEDIYNAVKQVTWGMRWMHYFDYQKLDPSERALVEYYSQEMGLQKQGEQLAKVRQYAKEADI